MKKQIGSFIIETNDGDDSEFSFEARELTNREKLNAATQLAFDTMNAVHNLCEPIPQLVIEILQTLLNLSNNHTKGTLSRKNLENNFDKITDTLKQINDHADEISQLKSKHLIELVGIRDSHDAEVRIEKLIDTQDNT